MDRIFEKAIYTLMLVLAFSTVAVPIGCAISERDEEPQEIELICPENVTAEYTKPQISYLGEYKITAYCSCEICCEQYGKNRPVDKNGNKMVYTASGKVAKQGITIAADKSIPFGTQLIVNGQVYIVQDRGGAVKENCLDIYFESHEEALNWGVQWLDVYTKKLTD